MGANDPKLRCCTSWMFTLITLVAAKQHEFPARLPIRSESVDGPRIRPTSPDSHVLALDPSGHVIEQFSALQTGEQSDHQRRVHHKQEQQKRHIRLEEQLVVEQTTSKKAARAQELSEETLRWAALRNFSGVGNLEVAEFRKGLGGRLVRGLTVKQPVKAGDVILTVPADSILHTGSTRTLKYLREIFELNNVPTAAISAASHELRLASSLLALHNFAHDEWGGYFDSLPSPAQYREFHPTMAQTEMLEAFQDLPIASKIKKQQLRRADHLSEFWGMGGRVSAEDWEWAEVVVSSRAWASSRGPSAGIMMVPVADFVNSGLESEQNVYTSIGDPDKGEPFRFIAKKDIEPGMELLDYFLQGNDELWVESWGTIVPGNGLQYPVPRLHNDECTSLGKVVGPALSREEDTCRAPEGAVQKGTFCTFARLASEHCPDYIPCPISVCGPRYEGIFGELRRASEERPWLVRALMLLGAVLIGIRSQSLMRLKPSNDPRSRRGLPSRTRVLRAHTAADKEALERKKVGGNANLGRS